MKKQFLSLVILLVLVLVSVGCQKEVNSEAVPPAQETTGEVVSETLPYEAAEMVTTPEIQTTGAIDGYLASFEAQLEASGLKLEGKAAKDAESIGGLEGYGFTIGSHPLEVYLFDANSSDEKAVENLKTARESGFITLYGVEINGKVPKANCTISGNLVLIFPLEDMFGDHPNKADIVKAFKDM